MVIVVGRTGEDVNALMDMKSTVLLITELHRVLSFASFVAKRVI